jgi:hypothetical protein
MMKPQISLCTEYESELQRSSIGDLRVSSDKHVDFEAFARSIDDAAARISVARPTQFPVVPRRNQEQ